MKLVGLQSAVPQQTSDILASGLSHCEICSSHWVSFWWTLGQWVVEMHMFGCDWRVWKLVTPSWPILWVLYQYPDAITLYSWLASQEWDECRCWTLRVGRAMGRHHWKAYSKNGCHIQWFIGPCGWPCDESDTRQTLPGTGLKLKKGSVKTEPLQQVQEQIEIPSSVIWSLVSIG